MYSLNARKGTTGLFSADTLKDLLSGTKSNTNNTKVNKKVLTYTT